jgi:hypothetical protein
LYEDAAAPRHNLTFDLAIRIHVNIHIGRICFIITDFFIFITVLFLFTVFLFLLFLLLILSRAIFL